MDPHAGQPVAIAGEPLGRAPVVILVHGRNAGPQNILDLVPRLARPGFTYLAPAAADRTWYPFGFMAVPETSVKQGKKTSIFIKALKCLGNLALSIFLAVAFLAVAS